VSIRDKSEADPASLPSWPLRYGVAVASVGLALGLKLLLDPITIQDTPFLLTFGAIMVSAWYGGLGPGLSATVLAALITDYFFLYPRASFSGLSPEAVSLVAFLVEGGLVSFLASSLRSATARAKISAQEAHSHAHSLIRSDERFRLLVEGVKDYAIFMLSSEGRVESWNEGARRIQGYNEEEILGRHFSVFDTEEDIERSHSENELRVAISEGRYEEEGMRVRKDGSRFWASVLITALRDEAGNLRGFSKVVRDITERKQSEEALQRSFDSLLALYEAGRVLGSSLQREEIGARLLEITERVSGLEAAVIDLRDEQGRMSEWRSVGPEEVLAAVREQPEVRSAVDETSKGQRSRSMQLRRAQNTEDARPLTGVFLPLRVRGRVIGVLEAYGPHALAEKETMATLSSFASQAASALENARLYEELAERERELHDLVGRIMEAQEEERRRVAYEVHDGFTQMAAAAYRRLALFAEYRPPESEQDRKELENIVRLVQQTVGEARRVIANLRPTTLDDFGLATAIRMQVEELRADGYETSYEETLGEERFPATLETALFRVAQEAMTNVRKHAKTDRVRVALGRRDGIVRVEVRDWGSGFAPEEIKQGAGPGERVGLSSMRARIGLLGGGLEILSEPGHGTTVVAEVSLSATEEETAGGE
jgi:PAS domain S-box-containing protein